MFICLWNMWKLCTPLLFASLASSGMNELMHYNVQRMWGSFWCTVNALAHRSDHRPTFTDRAKCFHRHAGRVSHFSSRALCSVPKVVFSSAQSVHECRKHCVKLTPSIFAQHWRKQWGFALYCIVQIYCNCETQIALVMCTSNVDEV